MIYTDVCTKFLTDNLTRLLLDAVHISVILMGFFVKPFTK